VIGPKRQKQRPRDKEEAYELATLRDRGQCQMPADVYGPHGGEMQRDHRQNRDDHNTVVENLQLLCVVHHKWKTENPAIANRTGWGCPRYERPADWPARRVVDGHLEWVRYLPTSEYFGHGEDMGFIVISDVEAAGMRRGFVVEEVLDAS
jgi:hypothetical protein